MPALPEAIEAPSSRIAIGVSGSHQKLHILKWALENVVPMNGKVYLIHVQLPLRRIPNALGAKFPIEKVDPDMVKRYKIHRFLEAQKLLDKYKRLCENKKIQTEICYSESDSVRKELVSQGLRLGIEKLVLGMSSRSLLSRALKKDSISKYVAKYSPAFCTVIVVNKGRVCFEKPATEAPTVQFTSCISQNDSVVSTVSEITADGDDACEEDSRTRVDMHSGGGNSWAGSQNGSSISSRVSVETSSQCSLFSGSCDHHDDNWCRPQTPLPTGVGLSEETLEDSSGMVHKQITEHGVHWLETLSSAKTEMHPAEKDTIRYRESLTALKVAMRDHEKLSKKLAEEVTRHKETQMELLRQRQIVNVYLEELACAKDRAEAEQRRCEDTLKKLKDMARKLETEYKRRKDAEEMASQEVLAKLAALAALEKKPQGCYEYSFQELRSATNDFNEENKLRDDRCCPIYKGKLHHTTVAIKVIDQETPNGHQEFHKEVELLNSIRHPYILTLMGACPEKGCIVYEYMANGSLEDRLNCKGGTPPLPWYIRFRVCLEVTTALLFLQSHPKALRHCGLNAADILFDSQFVSKIGGFGLIRAVLPCTEHNIPVETLHHLDPDYQCTGIDICNCHGYALGIIILQLLTGKPTAEVISLAKELERSGTVGNTLDYSAGDWPLEEATKLAQISLQCANVTKKHKLETDILSVLKSIQSIVGSTPLSITQPIIPCAFFCPIYKDIMSDPYIAADGFTYEHRAIKAWLQANNTSPMTNLRLDHKNLTPNFTMRSAIKDWHGRGLI